jgi:hypothetical protein
MKAKAIFCTVRKDLQTRDLHIPIGKNSFIPSLESGNTKIRYRWTGPKEDNFQVFFKGWKNAQSIDFDF